METFTELPSVATTAEEGFTDLPPAETTVEEGFTDLPPVEEGFTELPSATTQALPSPTLLRPETTQGAEAASFFERIKGWFKPYAPEVKPLPKPVFGEGAAPERITDYPQDPWDRLRITPEVGTTALPTTVGLIPRIRPELLPEIPQPGTEPIFKALTPSIGTSRNITAIAETTPEMPLEEPRQTTIGAYVPGGGGQPAGFFQAIRNTLTQTRQGPMRLMPFIGTGMRFVQNRDLRRAQERLKVGNYEEVANRDLENHYGNLGIYNPTAYFHAPREELVAGLATEKRRQDEDFTQAMKVEESRQARVTRGGRWGRAMLDLPTTLLEYAMAGAAVEATGWPLQIAGQLVDPAKIESLKTALAAWRAMHSVGMFAARETALKGLKLMAGEPLDKQDLKDLAEAPGMGALFGTVPIKGIGGLTAQGALGFGISYIQGADTTDSAINAALFMALAISSRADLDVAAKKLAVAQLSISLGGKLHEAAGFDAAMTPEQAQSIIADAIIRGSGEKTFEAALNKIARNPNTTWDILQKAADAIDKLGIRPEGEIGGIHATEEWKVAGGGKLERAGAHGGRAAAEAGGGYRAGQGGEVAQQVTPAAAEAAGAQGVGAALLRQEATQGAEAAAGPKFEAVTPVEDVTVAGKWIVMPGADIITSDMPGYDQSLQPRNRATQASKEQIARIAQNPDPLRLGESAVTDSGAPILDQRGQVLSGNARVLGIRQAYENKRAKEYEEFVRTRAAEMGLNIEGMDNPVLVRVAESQDPEWLKRITELSNRPQILARTPAEQAESDAKELLNKNIIGLFNPNALGEIRTAGNNPFLAAFVNATGDQSLRNADGTFNEAITGRVRRAILAAILGRSPQGRTLTMQAVESAEELGIKRQLDGIMLSGPNLLKLAQTKPTLDITGFLAQAMRDYMAYKRQRAEGKVKDLGEFLAQADMFAPRAKVTGLLIQEIDAAADSAGQMKEFLDDFVRLAQNVETSTISLFAEMPETKVEDIVRRARRAKQEITDYRSQVTGQTGGAEGEQGRGVVPAPSAGEPVVGRAEPAAGTTITDDPSIKALFDNLDGLMGRGAAGEEGTLGYFEYPGRYRKQLTDEQYVVQQAHTIGEENFTQAQKLIVEAARAKSGEVWPPPEAAPSSEEARAILEEAGIAYGTMTEEDGLVYGLPAPPVGRGQAGLPEMRLPIGAGELRKSPFRQYLEAVAGVPVSALKSDVGSLIAREAQRQARALIEAQEAGRIGEMEAKQRFQAAADRYEALAAKAEEREAIKAKSLADSMQENLIDLPAEGALFAMPDIAGGGAMPTRDDQLNAAAMLVSVAAKRLLVVPTPELARTLLEGRYGTAFETEYPAIAQTAHEMLRNDEAELWLGIRGPTIQPGEEAIKHEPKAEVGGTTEERGEGRAVGPGQTDVGAVGRAGAIRRTDLRTLDERDLPKPQDHVGIGKYVFAEHQRYALNSMLDALLVKDRRGYLLMDGPGVGKTSPQLACAHEYRQRTGGRILIVVPNEQVLRGPFLTDSSRMGISLGNFDFATRVSLKGGKILRNIRADASPTRAPLPEEPYDLVIYDEAHHLKNLHMEGPTAIASIKQLRKAKHIVFSTATPTDKGIGSAYFIAEITGVPLSRLSAMLGFTTKTIEDPETGKSHEVPVLSRGFSWATVADNIAKLRVKCVRDGVLLRREFPFMGDFEDINITVSPDDKNFEARIIKYFDLCADHSRHPIARGRYGSQKTQTARHFIESLKIQPAIDRMQQSLDEGRNVVIFASFIKPTNRAGRPTLTAEGQPVPDWRKHLWDMTIGKERQFPGILEEIAAECAKRGIQTAKIYGTGDKTREVQKFQENKARVALATPASGAEGISLDDTVGNAPRDFIVLTQEFAADTFQQMLYRGSRATTASRVKIYFINAPGSFGDDRAREIRDEKLQVLKAIQGGEELDAAELAAVARGEVGTEEEPVGMIPPEPPGAEQKTYGFSEAPTVPAEGELGARGEPTAVSLLPEDDRNYTLFPTEVPEVLQLSRELMEGKHVKIAVKIGQNLGQFSPANKEITLKADIFSGLTYADREVMRKQARLYAEAVTKAAEETGETVDVKQIAEAKYQAMLQARIDQVRSEGSTLAAKTLAHEAGHLVDFLPEEVIKGRGNIFGHIASLKEYQNSMLGLLPERQEDLLTERQRNLIRNEARKAAGMEPKRGTSEHDAWKKDVADLYAQGVDKAAKEAGLVSKEEIIKELEELHKWWRGVEEIHPYFQKAAELYAEAVSVWLNNPAALEKRAPLFTRLVFGWIESKPKFKKLYLELMDSIAAGTVERDRVLNLREGFHKSDDRRMRLIKMATKYTPHEQIQRGTMAVGRRMGPMYLAFVRGDKIAPEASGPVRKAINDYLLQGLGDEYIRKLTDHEVTGPLLAAGLTRDDLNEYAYHMAVIYNRYVTPEGVKEPIGNPGGWEPSTSTARLADWRRLLGPERTTALEQAYVASMGIHQKAFIDVDAQFHILDPTFHDELAHRFAYATFSASRGVEMPEKMTIANLFEARYGKATGARIVRQIGFLGDIAGPADARLQKDLALNRWLYDQFCKRMCVNYFRDVMKDPLVAPSKTVFNGRYMEYQDYEDEHVGTIAFLDDGVYKSYTVPIAVAKMFNSPNSAWIEKFLPIRVMVGLHNFVKVMLVHYNLGFAGSQFRASERNLLLLMPGVTRFGKHGVKRFRKEAREAAISSMGTDPNPIAKEAYERRIMMPATARSGVVREQDISFEAGQKGAGVDPSRWLKPTDMSTLARIQRALWRFWWGYSNVTEINDRTFRIQAMLYENAFRPNLSPAQQQEEILTWGGDPAFHQQAIWNRWIDRGFQMFYGAKKEGAFSEAKAWRERPAETFWKYSKYVYLPRLLLFGLSSGLFAYWYRKRFRDEDEALADPVYFALDQWRQMSDSIEPYFDENYWVLPIGWDNYDRRECVFLSVRLGDSEQGHWRLLTKFLHKVLGRDDSGHYDFGTLAGMEAGGSPVINLMRDVGDAYVFDRNPVDRYTGRQIVDPDAFGIGGWAKGQYMMLDGWDKLGGSAIYRMKPWDLNPEYPPSPLRRFLRSPGFGTILGRWVRISSGGEQRIRLGSAEVEREQKLARWDVKQVMRRRAVTGKLTLGILRGRSAPYLQTYGPYLKSQITQWEIDRMDPQTRAFLSAPSRAAAAARAQPDVEY